MGKFLIIDPEDQTRKSVYDAFKSLDTHEANYVGADGLMPEEVDGLGSENIHEIHFQNSLTGVHEHLENNQYDIVIIDTRLLKTSFEAWMEKFRADCPINKHCVVALFTYDSDLLALRKYLKAGASDCFFKPLDRLIFSQKMLLLNSGSRGFEKVLFSFQTNSEIGIAHIFEIADISEYGVNVKTSTAFEVNEFVSLISEAFSEDTRGEVLARCYKCEKHFQDEGLHIASFVFVGIDPVVLTNIRRWIRQEYALQKQRAS